MCPWWNFFCKSPSFQHILINNFRRMRLRHENLALRRISFQILKQHSDFKSFIAKTFSGNSFKNENHKSYLGNKEQKTMFLVVSRSDTHFNFGRLLLACPVGPVSKITIPKNRVRWSKFIQVWLKFLTACFILNFWKA